MRVPRRASPCLLLLMLALPAAAGAAPKSWKHDRDAVLVKVDEFRLHTARQGAAAVSLGDHIYVFGGSNWAHSADNIERIDPEARRSKKLKPALFNRAFHAALVYDGRVYLFGGQASAGDYQLVSSPRFPGQRMANDSFEPLMGTTLRTTAVPRLEPRIECFDPAIGGVSVLGSMPHPRANMAAVVLGHGAHFVGGTEMGRTGFKQVARHDVFDFVSREWGTALELLNAREGPAAVVDRLLVVAGGRVRDRGLKAVEFFDPDERAWKFLPALDRAAAGHSLARLDRYLFLFGGYDSPKKIVAYDLARRTSRTFEAGLSPVSHSAAVVHGDRLYVIGGKPNSQDNETDLVQVFALNPDHRPE
ncbi:MAG TPA: kelch repeat-containing protein [Opitutaceae bacterium]|nr:kelch repeat-containing protein [Opitutaceae bacterium]